MAEQITIYSHFEFESWTGSVDLPNGEVENDLEFIFRMFNRVDEGDGARLETLGYRLPSLSVNDVVTMGGRSWMVAFVGWQEVPLVESTEDHAELLRHTDQLVEAVESGALDADIT